MIRKSIKRAIRSFPKNDYQTLNYILLHKNHVLKNIQIIRKQSGINNIIPVLKSNAYGHGLVQMTDILNDCDCSFVAVDGYFEAAQIRDISRHRLLVMGYIKPENVHLLDTKRCSFVVQDIAGLEAFGRSHHKVNIHLELNTGMNRLGLQPKEISGYLTNLKRFSNLSLEGVMTHLADADNENDDDFTSAQVKQFDRLIQSILDEGFQPKFIHIAQTAGSVKAKSKFANAIRLGIGLYGINPLMPGDAHYDTLDSLKPVLSFKSTIIKTIELKPGDRVSYNGIYTASKPTKIAVLPAGYYEGIPRALSNSGIATAKDKNLGYVGRVCMNHTMVDITGTNLTLNDEVTLINDDKLRPNSVQNLCQTHGLFSYALVTGLSSSIRRIVTD